jgi:hypothetical protein
MRKTAVVALLVPLAILGAAGLVSAAERLELEVDGMVCPFCEADRARPVEPSERGTAGAGAR